MIVVVVAQRSGVGLQVAVHAHFSAIAAVAERALLLRRLVGRVVGVPLVPDFRVMLPAWLCVAIKP